MRALGVQPKYPRPIPIELEGAMSQEDQQPAKNYHHSCLWHMSKITQPGLHGETVYPIMVVNPIKN